MSEAADPRQPPPLPEEEVSSGRMILAMGTIGLLAGVLLVFTYYGTLPAIQRNKAEALERAIFDVLPGAVQSRTFRTTDGVLSPLADGDEASEKYYAAYDDAGELIGVAVEAAGQGYADTLRIMYGYSPGCQCVVGFTVLESKETPGLGDKIETDPAFTANFEALDLRLGEDGASIANPVTLVKPGQKTQSWQIEGITGATISSRAVADILRASSERSIALIENNSEVLRDGSPGKYTAAVD